MGALCLVYRFSHLFISTFVNLDEEFGLLKEPVNQNLVFTFILY